MSTLIADVIVPEVFTPYTVQRTNELSALYRSGIIESVANLNLLGVRGGQQIQMPYWNDLTGADEVLSDTSPLTPGGINAGMDVAVLHARGRAWSANDLAKALSGDDPMRAIGDLVADYWARRMQVLLLSTLDGVFAATSMSGNYLDLAAGNGTGDTASINSSTTVDAIQLLGDAKSKLTGFMMHSATEAYLAKRDMIQYEQESGSDVRVPYYLGKPVIVDDSCPVEDVDHDADGTTATVKGYTTYIFGQGAIGLGDGSAPVPTETDRDSLQGDDILINRKHFVLHPRGIKWIGNPAGAAPTNAEVGTGTNWERVYENKSIRMVKFRHQLS